MTAHRAALIATYVVVLILMLMNFLNIPMNELYLIIQAVTLASSLLLYATNVYDGGWPEMTWSHALMLFILGAFALSFLVRMGIYFYFRARGLHDQNKEAPMVRWDAFSAGFIFFLFITRAFYSSIPDNLPFSHVFFLILVVMVVPLITFLPYLANVPSLDKAIANKCVEIVQKTYAVLETKQEGHTYFYYNKVSDVTLAIENDDASGVTYVGFNGSRSGINWTNNFKFTDQTLPQGWLPDDSITAKVHRGFYDSYMSVDSELLRHIKEAQIHPKIVVTGHSLGGAMATLCALRLAGLGLGKHIEVITFGAPQVGDAQFVRSFDRAIQKCVRVVNPHDPVPEILRMQLLHTKGYFPVGALGRIGTEAHSIEAYEDGIQRGILYSVSSILAPVALVLVAFALICWMIASKTLLQ